MRAYLNGIPFHVLEPIESSEWEIKVTEFVTKHPPIVRRMGKGPSRFCISALLVGKNALLTKDILLKTLDDEQPSKLIHPLFGMRQVICARYNVQGFSNSLNAYILEIEFIEKKDALGTLSTLSKLASDASHLVQGLATSFFLQMEILQELRFNVEKFASLAFQIKGFLTSPSGVGTISDTLLGVSGSVTDVLSIAGDPKKLFAEIYNATLSLGKNPRSLELVAESISKLSIDPSFYFLKDTCMILLVFFSDAELSKSLAQHVSKLMDKAGSGVVTDEIFSYLWERSLGKTKTTEPTRQKTYPSLVASYQDSSDLEKAEEMSYEAGQPFAV